MGEIYELPLEKQPRKANLDDDTVVLIKLTTIVPAKPGPENRFVIDIEGEILLESVTNGAITPAGKFRLLHIKCGDIVNAGVSLSDALDAHSEEALDVCEDLWPDDNLGLYGRSPVLSFYEIVLSDLLLIEGIIVNEPFRNRGIGKQTISAILRIYSYCQIIAVKGEFDSSLREFDVADPALDYAVEIYTAQRDAINSLRLYFENFGFRLTTAGHMTYSPDLVEQPSCEEAAELRNEATEDDDGDDLV